jgi:hypothetical protein
MFGPLLRLVCPTALPVEATSRDWNVVAGLATTSPGLPSLVRSCTNLATLRWPRIAAHAPENFISRARRIAASVRKRPQSRTSIPRGGTYMPGGAKDRSRERRLTQQRSSA